VPESPETGESIAVFPLGATKKWLKNGRIRLQLFLSRLRMFASPIAAGSNRRLDLARVLLVHGELAPRLTLKTILQAGGYAVDVAATPTEALAKLDGGRYELVLSNARFGSREAGQNVLAYARLKDYRPATALIVSEDPAVTRLSVRGKRQVAIRMEDLLVLLGKVAELIGVRASERSRALPKAG
jgi:CheY-like chemotaxis protein